MEGSSGGRGSLTERRHYRNAPIIEATISFEIAPSTTPPAEELSSIHDFIQEEYPEVREEFLYEGQTSIVEPGGPAEHDDVHEHVGYGFAVQTRSGFFASVSIVSILALCSPTIAGSHFGMKHCSCGPFTRKYPRLRRSRGSAYAT